MEQSKFYQIKNVTEHGYTLVGCDGGVITRPIQEVDKIASAFTIQDAKDGDVLAYNDGSLTIFRYRLSGLDAGLYMSHILLTDKIEFKQTCAISNVHPATKEQRDLLFQKMKEAGYEWDAEKKELKKIEQTHAEWGDDEGKHKQDVIIQINPSEYINDIGGNGCYLKNTAQDYAWNEEDEKIYQSIMDDTVQENQLNDEQTNWLKDIKYRYFPQQKSDWSEEDESMRTRCIGILGKCYMGELPTKVEEELNWLKSLRPQKWKPSEEQIKALEQLEEMHVLGCEKTKENAHLYVVIKSLKEQLKQL